MFKRVQGDKATMKKLKSVRGLMNILELLELYSGSCLLLPPEVIYELLGLLDLLHRLLLFSIGPVYL